MPPWIKSKLQLNIWIGWFQKDFICVMLEWHNPCKEKLHPAEFHVYCKWSLVTEPETPPPPV